MKQRGGDQKDWEGQNFNKYPPAHVKSPQSVLQAATSASDTVLPEPSQTQLGWFEPSDKKLFHIQRCFLGPHSYSAGGSIRRCSPAARGQHLLSGEALTVQSP